MSSNSNKLEERKDTHKNIRLYLRRSLVSRTYSPVVTLQVGTRTCALLIMVIELSGVQFGLKSYA